MKANNKYIVMSVMLALMTACSNQHKPGPTFNGVNNQEAPTNQRGLQAGEHTHAIASATGEIIGSITEKISEDGVENSRKTSQETTLIPAAVDSRDLKFSRELYLIKGTSDEGKIYLAPKVYVMPDANSNQYVDNNDGTVSIPFKVVVADGLQNKISNPGSDVTEYPLPGELALNEEEKAELTRRVQNRYGLNSIIAGMRGCPTSIFVNIDDGSYDVTPTAFKTSDYCQMNRAFSVSLRLPKDKAKTFLMKLLPANNATLYMQFSLQIPTVIGRLSVNLDRSKLYEALKSQLQHKNVASKYEIKLALERLLAQNQINISMVGSTDEMIQQLLPAIIKDFFSTPEELGINRPADQQCSVGQTCFLLNYNKTLEAKSFNVDVQNISATRIAQVLESHTLLVSSNHVPLYLGPSENNPNAEYLSNKKRMKFIGHSPSRGSSIRIRPVKYLWENHKVVEEYVTRSEAWEECVRHIGGGPWGHGVCVEKRTVRYTELAQYGFEWTEVLNPLFHEGSMLQEIDVVFQLSSGKLVNCPLHTVSQSNSIESVVFLDNSKNCLIFSSNKEEVTNIGFESRVNRGDRSYVAGKKIDTQNHSTQSRSEYVEVRYNPEVKLALEVTLDSGLISKDLKVK